VQESSSESVGGDLFETLEDCSNESQVKSSLDWTLETVMVLAVSESRYKDSWMLPSSRKGDSRTCDEI